MSPRAHTQEKRGAIGAPRTTRPFPQRRSPLPRCREVERRRAIEAGAARGGAGRPVQEQLARAHAWGSRGATCARGGISSTRRGAGTAKKGAGFPSRERDRDESAPLLAGRRTSLLPPPCTAFSVFLPSKKKSQGSSSLVVDSLE